MSKKRKLPEIVITELFLVKADWQRTFTGTIRRETDVDGNTVVMGEVIVQEGTIWSKATNQDELMKIMDDICIMKLNYELHSHAGKTVKLFNIDFSLN
jgi:hypothetical protein